MSDESAYWSYERLLSLAPDATTLERARRLFFAKGWQLIAGNDSWLWGEYHTLHGHQCLTAVRLEPPLFRCSCNSRKQPCKHALALLLLFLNKNDVFLVRESMPDWVIKHSEKKEERPTSHHEDYGEQEKRLALMSQGVSELDKWLQTIARKGLASFLDNLEDWEAIAARMVDAKLGSIARRIRLCKQLTSDSNHLSTLAGELGLLYFFVRAWQRKATLSPSQKRELLQVAGWNIRKDSLLSQEGIKDNWLVLGIISGQEDQLRFRRTWLRAENNGRLALLLDFAFGQNSFEEQWIVGSVLNGELIYYPGQPSYRAIFKQHLPASQPYESPPGYANLNNMLKGYATALGQSPWLNHIPVLLDAVYISFNKDQKLFHLIDSEHSVLTMENSEAAWVALSLSGGNPISLFGEYNGDLFTPISSIHEGRIISF